MISLKLIAKVFITKDQAILLNKSNQSRIIEVYCVRTLDGIKSYISIYEDISKSKKIEFSLNQIKKLHKNFINEGKLTIVIQTKQGSKSINCTFNSAVMIKDLQEVVQETNIYISEAAVELLTDFI